MPLNRPFVYAVPVTIAANSVNSASFLVGIGQTFDLYRILTDNVTSGLNVTGLRDSTGLQYTFASTSAPIPMNQLGYPGKANMFNVFEFVKPLTLIGQLQFIIDVQNSGGTSQTVNFAFIGFMTVGGGG